MSQSISLYNQLANHKLFSKSINFGLNRIKLALGLLGHPEKKLKNVISVMHARKHAFVFVLARAERPKFFHKVCMISAEYIIDNF